MYRRLGLLGTLCRRYHGAATPVPADATRGSKLLAVSLTGLLGAFGFEKDHNDLSRQIDEATQLVEEGNTAGAKNAILDILKWSKREHVQEKVDKVANLAFIVGEYDKARALFTDALTSLQQEGVDENNPRVLQIKLKLAQISQQLAQDSKAEEEYKQCKEMVGIKYGEDGGKWAELWIQILESYADFRAKMGDWEAAVDNLSTAYDASVRVNGEVHENSLVLLRNLGNICLQRGDVDKAIGYLDKASNLGQHFPNSKILSSIHVSLGKTYLQRGLFKQARDHCDSALNTATMHLQQDHLRNASQCIMEATNALN